MQRRPQQTTRISETLGSVLRRFDSEQNLRAYQIWGFWDEEVGDAIARHTQPEQFRNGILTVLVDSHSWLQELQFLKEDLRNRLNARLGEELLRDLNFESGAVEKKPARASIDRFAAPAETSLTPELPALPPLADPELAAAFVRLATARARRAGRTRQR